MLFSDPPPLHAPVANMQRSSADFLNSDSNNTANVTVSNCCARASQRDTDAGKNHTWSTPENDRIQRGPASHAMEGKGNTSRSAAVEASRSAAVEARIEPNSILYWKLRRDVLVLLLTSGLESVAMSVLERLDVVDLKCCQLVCRQWRGLVERLWAHHEHGRVGRVWDGGVPRVDTIQVRLRLRAQSLQRRWIPADGPVLYPRNILRHKQI